MRLIIVQKDINDRNFTPYLEFAKARKADLICFGELATSGALYKPREVEPFDQVAARFSGYDFAIMAGLPYRADGRFHNSYMYFHKGHYQFYHKINLFPGMNEPNVFMPGTEPGIMKTPFGTVGASICYDIRFPEVYSRLKQLGAQKIFVPAAFPLVRIDDWRNLLIERAKEHQVMMIGINAVGDDGTNVFGGTSMVVGPDGSVLAEADRQSACLLEVEIS
jgi:predicted amidohydrolase